MKENGTPLEIAELVTNASSQDWPDPYQCSLCGLCRSLCPEGLKPESLFLTLRQELVERCGVNLKQFRPILFYETIGRSSLFSFIQVPFGGDTVLFPGCALSGTRPATVRRLYTVLAKSIPHLGIALGCCVKPSHDLGRQKFFQQEFSSLCARLTAKGVQKVVTACPNCQRVFQTYAPEIEAVTAYSFLAHSGFRPPQKTLYSALVHDPCPQRNDDSTMESVRVLAERCGIRIEKNTNEKQLTRCCGEGGMVKFTRPEFASSWSAALERKMKGRKVITSCAGCTGFLRQFTEAEHILDIVLGCKSRKVANPPLTYLHRLVLKWWFQKRLE